MARYVHRKTGKLVYAQQWRGFNEDTMTDFLRPATFTIDGRRRLVIDGSGLAAEPNAWLTREPATDLVRVVYRDEFARSFMPAGGA